MGKRLTIIFTIFLAGYLLLLSQPALAITRDVRVCVSVKGILSCEYTGDPTIYFDINENDLMQGYKVREDLGDLNWKSNYRNWMVTVARTEWDTDNGDPDREFWLQVKFGGDENNNWVTVPELSDPNAPAVWIQGNQIGCGTYTGVDWRINDLTQDMKVGMYWCTVIIAIEPIE
jgi:hypothetical protein